MKRSITLFLCVVALVAWLSLDPCYGEWGMTPLEYLREQEIKHKDIKGEVYLGKVLTLHYLPYALDADEKDHPLLLELTDLLKTPLRNTYRMVLKGYSDNSGAPEENRRISLKRAERLRWLLIQKYYMEEGRITTEGFGESSPVASNETAEGRRLNRRVEIHLYGDVSEAVRFIED